MEFQIMPINSRQKGARFERWVSQWFRFEGWGKAIRGCQFSGRNVSTGEDAPDVIVPGVTERMHIECKAVERLNLQDAMDQAKRDAGEKIPCVIHKRNNCEPMATILLKDLPKFLRGDLPPNTKNEKEKENNE